MTFKTLNLAEARTCLALSRENTPATKGVQVGGGIHVPLVDKWDGQSDEVPIGWTGIPLTVDETKGEYVVYIDEKETNLEGEKLAQLETFKARATTETVVDEPIKVEPAPIKGK